MRFMNPVIEVIAGTTLKTTWVNSGVTPSPIFSRMVDAAETLVHSQTATSSGNGLFYAVHPIPNSAQWLVNEWRCVIDANTYVNRQLVRVRALETD